MATEFRLRGLLRWLWQLPWPLQAWPGSMMGNLFSSAACRLRRRFIIVNKEINLGKRLLDFDVPNM
ncbi:MAG: hypothetical protein COZ12_09785 [Deltaproteobacteria bacterium CG_4_10_14_3_um_filter_60_8]|nr:MAG: hypothetical protein AUK28_00110 [Desulfobacterales bacterium CG2_30_60_27]PIP43752.1 MAG: hypothetical protein COX17_05255 [Deltaproteobacteria bacterium CG23_combo_of_CG06-09_8_20_14_all_60_8]PIY20215.1 MAG: hypothetical protein COZ12_09785 [Deltaproteobacteria bacterium CG_4_10_14_3_um_filter_60_8]